MSHPNTVEEYNHRYHENFRIEGYGIEGVTNHFPCPFCAAADWYICRIIDFSQTSPKLTCSECGRTAQLLYKKDWQSSSIECVQTAGDDQPSWLNPQMRRV